MQVRKAICIVLTFVLCMESVMMPVRATEVEDTAPEIYLDSFISPLATGSFNMTIPANTNGLANSSFPLAAGETVTIKASYSPFSASVDFGLVAPNGKYYYFNITDGSIDETIQVNESGSYTLKIRNNSNGVVYVSGFVNY